MQRTWKLCQKMPLSKLEEGKEEDCWLGKTSCPEIAAESAKKHLCRPSFNTLSTTNTCCSCSIIATANVKCSSLVTEARSIPSWSQYCSSNNAYVDRLASSWFLAIIYHESSHSTAPDVAIAVSSSLWSIADAALNLAKLGHDIRSRHPRTGHRIADLWQLDESDDDGTTASATSWCSLNSIELGLAHDDDAAAKSDADAAAAFVAASATTLWLGYSNGIIIINFATSANDGYSVKSSESTVGSTAKSLASCTTVCQDAANWTKQIWNSWLKTSKGCSFWQWQWIWRFKQQRLWYSTNFILIIIYYRFGQGQEEEQFKASHFWSDDGWSRRRRKSWYQQPQCHVEEESVINLEQSIYYVMSFVSLFSRGWPSLLLCNNIMLKKFIDN